MYKLYFFIFFILFQINSSSAQKDITGTWEGDLSGREFLQMNVIQVKGKLCGYTWDYMFYDKKNYCKANFTGVYDKVRSEWLLNGNSFIANSGTHVLMRIRLKSVYIDGKMVLQGRAAGKSLIDGVYVTEFTDDVYLEKVSNKPIKILDKMKDCYNEQPKPKPVEPKPKPIEPKPKPKPIEPKPKPVEPKPKPVEPKPKPVEPKPVEPKPVEPKPIENVQLQQEMNNRKNKEVSRLEINVKNITLNVYDNATVDGDTVSVFYNDRLIVAHRRLSVQPIVINISLDENRPLHKITLFAENLGSIPPNTALIVVNAGEKRYELFSSSNLKENSVLIFEYKPK